MATVYKFQISLPMIDTLPRNRATNVVHFQHVVGSVLDTDLEGICSDLAALYQHHMGYTDKEVMVKAYDTDAKPNYPRATVVVSAGVPWTTAQNTETAICLSFAGPNRGDKSGRGRIYLPHPLSLSAAAIGLRPSVAQQNWALAWYTEPNQSFPDIGGADWKFGIWSKTYQRFTQAQQAWVNDDWDVQRRRGLRETSRVSATREG